ncbi:MAG: Ni/Fe hydrogenase subunit alpha [Myxococcota bacterium]
MAERRTIEVGALARVEGEGALHVTVEDGEVRDLRLRIYEPPRFFEGFLQGRALEELPDLTARICGICPVAYQMSSVHAIEKALGITPDPATRALRRLYNAGDWMESHLLHMMFLAAPDFLGLDDGMAVARLHREPVERALRLRKLGNRILSLLGGRPVNPVGVCIGGFHRAPTREELSSLAEALRAERGEAEVLLEWFATLPVPRRPQDVELVALRHPDEYPMNEGRIASSRGLDIAADAFEDTFEELQVPHSTALHSRIRGGGSYLVGPLARVTLNRERLSPAAGAALERVADRFATPDPAASVFARGVEVIQAMDDALAAIEAVAAAGPVRVPDWTPRVAEGIAVTEAPRGLLAIRVRGDARGDVEHVRIVPPTSQNQAQIEADLRALVPHLLDRPHEEMQRRCESAIRDYDPCISCAVHFLDLEVERVPS